MQAESQNLLVHELEHALDVTLEYAAAEVPFYRSRVTRRSGKGFRLADFPLIDRQTVDDNLGQLVVAGRFPDYVITSGGTSGQRLAITMRMEEEYEAVHRFLTGYGPREAPELDQIKEFVLDLYLNTNGWFRRKAVGWPTISIPIERRAHVELVRRLIVDGFELSGQVFPLGRIQSQMGVLRTLTGYFVVTGFIPAGKNIRSVTGYGGHISRVWRRRLQEIWGCSIDGRYGLSEFTVGNATKCASCGALHYLTAWPEFLSLRDLKPVEAGEAALVLTSLVPFVTVQPRIRYMTGDLVTVGTICENTGLRGFHFRGRSESSVWMRVGAIDRVIFSEIDVQEVIDQFMDVNIRRHTAEIQLWEEDDLPPPPFPIGSPRFSIRSGEVHCDRPQVEIKVEVIFDPADDRLRTAALIEAMRSAVYSQLQVSASNTEISDVDLTVDLVAPRTLR